MAPNWKGIIDQAAFSSRDAGVPGAAAELYKLYRRKHGRAPSDKVLRAGWDISKGGLGSNRWEKGMKFFANNPMSKIRRHLKRRYNAGPYLPFYAQQASRRPNIAEAVKTLAATNLYHSSKKAPTGVGNMYIPPEVAKRFAKRRVDLAKAYGPLRRKARQMEGEPKYLSGIQAIMQMLRGQGDMDLGELARAVLA